MYLARNIRFLRLSKGLSQDDVAKRLGYKSFTTIQKWESGVSEPPVKKLKELSILFGVDMDDLNSKPLDATVNQSKPQPSISLSDLEAELITKYRQADDVDREMVHRILHIQESIKKKDLA